MSNACIHSKENDMHFVALVDDNNDNFATISTFVLYCSVMKMVKLYFLIQIDYNS